MEIHASVSRMNLAVLYMFILYVLCLQSLSFPMDSDSEVKPFQQTVHRQKH